MHVYSHIAVVRSGPDDSDQYPVRFSKTDLFRTAEFYKTKDPKQIFVEREASRFRRKLE